MEHFKIFACNAFYMRPSKKRYKSNLKDLFIMSRLYYINPWITLLPSQKQHTKITIKYPTRVNFLSDIIFKYFFIL